jgi:hypothetical protein
MDLFTLVCYSSILSTTAKRAAAAAVLFFLFSTTGPFQGKIILFRGNTGSFEGHDYREKGRKVQNYYILLFLKKEVLNSTIIRF